MNFQEYLDKLHERLKNNFNIKINTSIDSLEIDMYAVCNIENSKYFGSKNLKIWSYEVNEHCLIITKDEELNLKIIQDYYKWLTKQINILIKTNPEHMQSYLTAVVVTSKPVNWEVLKYVEKIKYSKSFKFGLQGWCDLRFIVVDLATNKVTTNKKGEEVKKVYLPN